MLISTLSPQNTFAVDFFSSFDICFWNLLEKHTEFLFSSGKSVFCLDGLLETDPCSSCVKMKLQNGRWICHSRFASSKDRLYFDLTSSEHLSCSVLICFPCRHLRKVRILFWVYTDFCCNLHLHKTLMQILDFYY